MTMQSLNRKLGASLAQACTPLVGIATLLSLPACVEMDGPPLMHEVQQSSVCPVGTPRRKAVPKNIIDAFPTCCKGFGYLIPDYLIPVDFRSRLAKGKAGTLCVPTEFATDADFTPPKCTSVFGLKGVCLSGCLPEVTTADIQLPRSSCPVNTFCAPCIHPQTKKKTGACEFGKMACDPPEVLDDCKPFTPTPSVLKQYKPCCVMEKGRGHCAPGKFVEVAQQKDLRKCPDGQSFCVPDDMLIRGGKHQPTLCKALNGREGRCLSICIKSVYDQLKDLERSSCKADERCVPCYDPRTGMGTGSCTIGPCDKPKEKPKLFEECGYAPGDAYCIPSYKIPAHQRCHFDNKGCRSGCKEPNTLCVPKKMIDAGTKFSPQRCKASLVGFIAMFISFFNGNYFAAIGKMKEYSDARCISRCIKQIKANAMASFLSSKGCAAGEKCVPCYDPMQLSKGKVSTGACDAEPKCPK